MQICALLFAAIAALAGLTDDELAKVRRGEVPVRIESFTTPTGKVSGRGLGAILIHRPIADVWAVLTRYEDKAEYQPRVEKVWVLEKHPERLKVRMQIDASVSTVVYTANYEFDSAAHTIRWTLDKMAPGNTVVDLDGGYEAAELSSAETLVVYRAWVDSGRSVPRFISDYVSRRSIPNSLRAIKMRVESGGTYRKK